MALSLLQTEHVNNANSKIHLLLTSREKQILKLISLEYSDREIAEQLCLSHHTIHSHRKSLMQKFQVRKSVGLVRKGFEMEFLQKL